MVELDHPNNIGNNENENDTNTKVSDSSSLLWNDLGTIEKGSSDWREFRALHLENGMQCLLVKDRESRTVATSVAVGVGASSDPREMSGLAHFTEHMCFLGSEKYPGENEYKRYLSCHGGRSNASTSMNYTVYKFEILADFAETAVDIFAWFFIKPLFGTDALQREVQAVDSENSKNKVLAGRRRWQILKDVASDKSHHYTKFSTGDATTLTDKSTNTAHKLDGVSNVSVGDAMEAFHRRHYRPSNMTVVCVGPQELDVLQEWIVPRFGSVVDRWNDQNKQEEEEELTEAERLVERAAMDAPIPVPPYFPGINNASSPIIPTTTTRTTVPFRPAWSPPQETQQKLQQQQRQWPFLVTSQPVGRDARTLAIYVPMPPVRHVPETSPLIVLGHLLGHEGPGSAFAVLQDAGLISSLHVGSRVDDVDQCLFRIEVTLTEAAEQDDNDNNNNNDCVHKVVTVLFRHAHLVYETAVRALHAQTTNNDHDRDRDHSTDLTLLRRVWQEILELNAQNFHHRSPGSAYDLAPFAAQSLWMNGPTKCLSAGYGLSSSSSDDPPLPLPLEDLVDYAGRIVPSQSFVERCSHRAWEEALQRYGPADSTDHSNDKDINGDGNGYGFHTEQWYGVKYCVSPLDWKNANNSSSNSNNEVQMLLDQLKLPNQPNPYIAKNLSLCPELPPEAHQPRLDKPIDPPTLVVNDTYRRMWHRLDDRYALPRADLSLLIRPPPPHSHPDNSFLRSDICLSMLLAMFADAMAQHTYDATLVGLRWSLQRHQGSAGAGGGGILLRCTGYSNPQGFLELPLRVLQTFVDELITVPSQPQKKPQPYHYGKQHYFDSVHDRTVQSLSSYYKGKRADHTADWFIEFVLGSQRRAGVQRTLETARSLTLDDVMDHGRHLFSKSSLSSMTYECLLSGNVGRQDAETFFNKVFAIMDSIPSSKPQESSSEVATTTERSCPSSQWISGPMERRLEAGCDVTLHVEHRDPIDPNGAVTVHFQSGVPGYKGFESSSSSSSEDTSKSLRYSAALRLLGHMLREPVFDELRTKQQIGYVVQAFYQRSFSYHQPTLTPPTPPTSPTTTPYAQDHTKVANETERQTHSSSLMTKQSLLGVSGCGRVTPVESLVVNVLSKQFRPDDILDKIDECLRTFRETLERMPSSEIESQREALATKYLKPISKLSVEASSHFGDICRYAPEILAATTTTTKDDGLNNPHPLLPWDRTQQVASAIQRLERADLLEVWDATVADRNQRSRIASLVYPKDRPIRVTPGVVVDKNDTEEKIKDETCSSFWPSAGWTSTTATTTTTQLRKRNTTTTTTTHLVVRRDDHDHQELVQFRDGLVNYHDYACAILAAYANQQHHQSHPKRLSVPFHNPKRFRFLCHCSALERLSLWSWPWWQRSGLRHRWLGTAAVAAATIPRLGTACSVLQPTRGMATATVGTSTRTVIPTSNHSHGHNHTNPKTIALSFSVVLMGAATATAAAVAGWIMMVKTQRRNDTER